MILEHALLQVLPGKEAAFEAALAEAKPVISASPGFRGIEVRRDCETPGHYLLIVRWDSIADHREGFGNRIVISNGASCCTHFMIRCRQLLTSEMFCD